MNSDTPRKEYYLWCNQILNNNPIATPLIFLLTRPLILPVILATLPPFGPPIHYPITRNSVAASSVATVPSHIHLGHVRPPVTRTDPLVSLPDRNLPATGPAGQANDIVLRGTVPWDVTKPPAVEASTHVPYAVLPHTTRSNAKLLPNLLTVKTPFIPDEWEKMLNCITPFNSFSDVPNSFRFGFDMGVHTPPSQTYTPPNHNSAIQYPDHVTAHIRNELSLGRYSGPFSRSRLEYLIGPFRTSPLGTVPKSFGSSERRIVQDLSFPRNDPTRSSVNDQIDIEDFRCDWGTFNDIRAIVVDAPDGAEAATLDVDSAFRCCPILPSQQRNFIIHWNDSYYIDHNAPFGATSAGGVFGRTADAKSAILKSKGLGPSKNWVDDFVFFRFPVTLLPTPKFSYSLIDIYDIAKRLGWPWKESKTRPFSLEFKYLGFLWNLSTKTVQIPEQKKLRYLTRLSPWQKDQKFSKKDAESVLGTLVHCSLAVPDGRSRLPSLSRFAASFNFTSSPFVRRTPNPSVLADLNWWRTRLAADFCGSTLSKPPPSSSVEFWVDASSSWGIGIVFEGEWDSWKFIAGWDSDGRNIGWAEIVAIEIGLLFAIHKGYSDIHFLVKSDNQGVIHALDGGKSRSPTQNAVLQRITHLLSQHNLWFSSLYVPSSDNLADLPSRGFPATNRSHTLSSPTLPTCLHPFLSHVIY